MPNKTKRGTPDPDMLTRFWNNLVLSARLLLDRRVSTTTKLIPLLMALYILSPIDLIPDILLPFGVVDDLGVLVLGLQLFIHNAPPDIVAQYRGFVPRSHGKKDQDQFDRNTKNGAPHVIEGRYEVKDD